MSSTDKSINKIILNTLVIALSVIISLVSIEFLLTLKNSNMKNYDIEMWKYSKELKFKSPNPILGHEHIPSKAAKLQNVDIRLNEYGMRGAKIGNLLNYDRKILFLGSSITLGWGVDEKEVFTSLLQEEFTKSGQSTLVLNAGIGNYNTERYVELFFTKLNSLGVTDIVIHYFINDAEELNSGRTNWLLKNSQLAATIWMAIQKLSFFGEDTSLVRHYKNVYKHDSDGFKKMRRSLEKISDYAKSNQVNLYLTIIPDVHNLAEYPFHFIHESMEKIAEELNFKFLDLYPAFADIDEKDIWAMPGDPHPNALGHRIMKEQIYPILLE
jgi:lysophospholipase L1-like esterase